jgi:serine/threonine protein kinase
LAAHDTRLHTHACFNLHRDVALRNCIITKDLVVKLSSISLCKDKHANEYFKHNNKNVPLRHLAPEILQSSTFSTASDVFACGTTLWEVVNCGALPFGALANDELFQKLQTQAVDYESLFENDKLPKLKKTLVRITAFRMCIMTSFLLSTLLICLL